MIKLLKSLILAIAALAEKALQPDSRCVRGASEAARLARRRHQPNHLATCTGTEAEGVWAGVKP